MQNSGFPTRLSGKAGSRGRGPEQIAADLPFLLRCNRAFHLSAHALSLRYFSDTTLREDDAPSLRGSAVSKSPLFWADWTNMEGRPLPGRTLPDSRLLSRKLGGPRLRGPALSCPSASGGVRAQQCCAPTFASAAGAG
jgi:hypothetical protein